MKVAIDPTFTEWLTETVWVSTVSGVNIYGEPQVTSSSGISCRISPLTSIESLSGTEQHIVTQHAITIAGEVGVTIDYDSMFQLTENGKLHTPSSIAKHKNEDGSLHHYRVVI